MGFDCTKPQRPVWYPPQAVDLVTFGSLGAFMATVIIGMLGDSIGGYFPAVQVMLLISSLGIFVSLAWLHWRTERRRRAEKAYEEWEAITRVDHAAENDPRLTAQPRWIPYTDEKAP